MKNQIFLKIKQRGMVINFDGKIFRIPSTIDISHLNIKNVINKMRMLGIIDYEIIHINKNENKKQLENKKVKINKNIKNDKSYNNINNEEYKEQNNKIEIKPNNKIQNEMKENIIDKPKRRPGRPRKIKSGENKNNKKIIIEELKYDEKINNVDKPFELSKDVEKLKNIKGDWI